MQVNETNKTADNVNNKGQSKWWLLPTLLGAVSFGAVSYTHLDVYKRQDFNWTINWFKLSDNVRPRK